MKYYSSTSGNIECGYQLWFGFQFDGNPAMKKVGDPLRFGSDEYHVIGSDMDQVDLDNSWGAETSHPDRSKGYLAPANYENGSNYISRWYAPTGSYLRGNLDSNILFDDGRVERYPNVKPTDPRMGRVPYNRSNQFFPNRFAQIPLN